MLRCFLDIDGVLVDFMSAAHRFHGIPYSYKDYPYEYGDWDCIPPPTSEMTTQEFWDALNEEFWATIEWMPDGKEILHLVEMIFGVPNVCLLTSPTLLPRCASGKMRWIQREVPEYHRQFLIGPAKGFCANKDTILIDDADHNILSYRKNGGEAILVPRKWNRAWREADTSLTSLKVQLEGYWKSE